MTASVAALLLCAGKGERLAAGVDKPFAPLAGRPMFTWSLESLQHCGAIAGIVMVGPVLQLKEMIAASGLSTEKIVAWTEGGLERQQSVARGLHVLPAGFTTVAVHDCARALLTPDLAWRVVADALVHGAALAAVPVEDSLKCVTLNAVDSSVPRARIWRAQTPQAFRRDWLEEAHRTVKGSATDDASMVEALGHPVRITPGDTLNFKITNKQDLELAEAWLLSKR